MTLVVGNRSLRGIGNCEAQAFVQVCYGYYQVIQGNIERRQLKEERRERRAAILPFLQAEEDIRYLREYSKYLDEEKRVMKGVAGRLRLGLVFIRIFARFVYSCTNVL